MGLELDEFIQFINKTAEECVKKSEAHIEANKVKDSVIRALFAIFLENPNILPPEMRQFFETVDLEKLKGTVLKALKNPLMQKMFSGRAINALARTRTNGTFEPFEKKLIVDGLNIFLPESVQEIGVGAAKIFRYAVAEFTKHNPQNGTGEKLKLRFLLDVKDFAAANGIDTDSTSAMKNFRFKLNKSLNKLLKSSITWTEKIKGKETTFSGYNYIGGYKLRGNALELEFTLKMAEYITSLPLIEYPRSLYGLDDRDFNAFAIGEAMCIHYSQDNNVIKGTEGKMGVEALLKYTSFPNYEELKKHKWSWEEKVKEPFENCLDKLYQCGFLKTWSYCHSGDIELTNEEVRAGAIDSYEKFISLIVKFELNGYEDSKMRVQKIAEKKAEKIKKTSRKAQKQNKN